MPITGKFEADFSDFVTEAKKATASLTNIETSAREMTQAMSLATRVAGAFGVSLGISQVVQFGEAVLEAGDQIVKMADQTGLTIEQVQKFQYIAGQSGTSIESLVGAVQNLQQRLGDENSGAAGALRSLGIQADTFNKLGTNEQMLTLADAIQAIHDPTEQASVAAALFGKTWKEILPAIKAGMREVGDEASVMSDATARSLDRLGDAFKSFKQRATAEIGSWAVFLMDHFSTVDDSAEGFTKQLDAMQKQAAKGLPQMASGFKDLTMSALETKHAEDDLNASIKEGQKVEEDRMALLKQVHEVEQSNHAFSLKALDEINQTSATANAHLFAERLTGYAALSKAEAALNDDIAKATLSSADYQIMKIWEVVAEQEKAFVGELDQREQFNAAVEALAQRQTDVIIAQKQREVDAAAAAEAAKLTIVTGHGPDVPLGGAGTPGQLVGGFGSGYGGGYGGGYGAGVARDYETGTPLTRTYQFAGGINVPADILAAVSGMIDSQGRDAEVIRQMKLRGLLPSYASGGPVLQDGAIYAHRGEYVMPAGGGSGLVANIYVTQPLGTPDAIGKAVDAALMQILKRQKLWPST